MPPEPVEPKTIVGSAQPRDYVDETKLRGNARKQARRARRMAIENEKTPAAPPPSTNQHRPSLVTKGMTRLQAEATEWSVPSTITPDDVPSDYTAATFQRWFQMKADLDAKAKAAEKPKRSQSFSVDYVKVRQRWAREDAARGLTNGVKGWK